MTVGSKPGPLCLHLGADVNDGGTLALTSSRPPVTVGLVAEPAKIVLDQTSPPDMLLKDFRVRALLDVIAFAEGADYDTMVHGEGSYKITDFSKHPNVIVTVSATLKSTAAGRYQFLYSTWTDLGMPDFTPESQDIAAVKLLKRRKMITPLLEGNVEQAILNGNREWASLPGSPYGQPTHTMAALISLFNERMMEYTSPFDVAYIKWYA